MRRDGGREHASTNAEARHKPKEVNSKLLIAVTMGSLARRLHQNTQSAASLLHGRMSTIHLRHKCQDFNLATGRFENCASRHAGIRCISLHGRDSAEVLMITGRLMPTVAGSSCLLLIASPRRIRSRIKLQVSLPWPIPCVLVATLSWHQRELHRICRPPSVQRP